MVLAATMTSVSESSAKHWRGIAGVENMSSASGMCQAYPVYTSGAPEDVSTALHGSGEGSLCTQGHASCGAPLYAESRSNVWSDPRTDRAQAQTVSCGPRVVCGAARIARVWYVLRLRISFFGDRAPDVAHVWDFPGGLWEPDVAHVWRFQEICGRQASHTCGDSQEVCGSQTSHTSSRLLRRRYATRSSRRRDV